MRPAARFSAMSIRAGERVFICEGRERLRLQPDNAGNDEMMLAFRTLLCERLGLKPRINMLSAATQKIYPRGRCRQQWGRFFCRELPTQAYPDTLNARDAVAGNDIQLDH